MTHMRGTRSKVSTLDPTITEIASHCEVNRAYLETIGLSVDWLSVEEELCFFSGMLEGRIRSGKSSRRDTDCCSGDRKLWSC